MNRESWMRTLRAALFRLGGMFGNEQRDLDLSDELESHLCMHTEENLRRGLAPGEARRQALLKLGGVEQTKEIYRERRGLPVIETLLQDLRFGWRMLRKNLGFTVVAVITLALSIGANSAIFSVIDGVLLRPLPYKDSDQLIFITTTNVQKGIKGLNVSFTKITRVKEQTRTLQGIAATLPINTSFSNRGTPEQLPASLTTANLFEVFGVVPSLGRGFRPEEDQEGGADVAIVSDAFWHSHFGGAPDIIGRTLSLDGKSVLIVGVLPATFHFPFQQSEPDVWFPRVFDNPALGPARIRSGASYLTVYARLRPGESLARCQAELEAINQTYKQDFSGYVDASNYSLDAVSLKESLVGPLRVSLLVLLAAVGFVLMIGCANIASMLLARSTSRQREIAIRQAMGASRGRLTRQLLTESVLLSAVGGIFGVILAAGCLRLLRLLPPGTIPRADEISLDTGVLIFSIVLCVVTGIAFGLAPSLLASRGDLHETLKEGGRSANEGRKSRSSRAALVVLEVAVAVVLVTSAGLLVRSFGKLMQVNPGFDSSQLMTFTMTLPQPRYPQPAQHSEFYRRLVESVQTLPGVQTAGVSSFLPLNGALRYVYFCAQGMVCQGIGKDPIIAIRQVTPDYLQTMRIPLLRGRAFNDHDIAGVNPVVIINQNVATTYFPNQDPIGKHLANSRDMIQMEIVGVVGDVKFTGLNTPYIPEMYLPQSQNPAATMTLVVRSSSNPQPLVAAVRQKTAELDSDLPFTQVLAMSDVVSASVAQPRLTTLFTGFFAALALLLTAVGIYGVLAYSVTQRTRELGIRMALGASRAEILKMVVGQGMHLVFSGLIIGLAVSLIVTRLLATLLFGTSARDPLTFAAVIALLVVVALVAAYIPARRAAMVDPIVALRYE
jgi:putative ABC transport system permease protein